MEYCHITDHINNGHYKWNHINFIYRIVSALKSLMHSISSSSNVNNTLSCKYKNRNTSRAQINCMVYISTKTNTSLFIWLQNKKQHVDREFFALHVYVFTTPYLDLNLFTYIMILFSGHYFGHSYYFDWIFYTQHKE